MRVHNVVQDILERSEAARSNDKLLRLEVYAFYGLKLTPQQEDIFLSNLPSDETITRIRRKLQEEGKYPANPLVRKTRQFKSWQVQQAMPKTKSDKVQRLLDEIPTVQQRLI
jgi:hypothetical protein